jgi:hypothetical protein
LYLVANFAAVDQLRKHDAELTCGPSEEVGELGGALGKVQRGCGGPIDPEPEIASFAHVRDLFREEIGSPTLADNQWS